MEDSKADSDSILVLFSISTLKYFITLYTSNNMYIPALGAIACLFALGALIWQTVLASPFKFLILIALIGSAFAIEKAYNLYTGRKIKPLIKPTGRMKTKNRSESENLKS